MDYFLMLHKDGRRPFEIAEGFLRAVVGDQGTLSYPTKNHKKEGVICLTCPKENEPLIAKILENPEIVIQDGGIAYIGRGSCIIGFHPSH